MSNCKLNLLQVATHSNISRGGAVQLYGMVRQLVHRGHRVTTVFQHETSERLAAETETQIRALGADYYSFDRNKLIDHWHFRKFVKHNNFDLIHCHRDPALVFVYKSLFGLSSPPLLVQRGTTYPLKKYSWENFIYHRNRLDGIIGVAEAVKDILVNQCKVSPEKVRVIYGGVDPEKFNPVISGVEVRKELSIPLDAPVVGMAAALHPKKGHEIFLAAAALVTEQFPETRFLLAGGGKQKTANRLREQVKELNLDDKIILAGFRSDMPEVLAVFDISVCSSLRGEGLTGSLRESMAMAKPVISSNVSGNSEIVLQDQTGLLVPPGEPKPLAEAIIHLLKNRELADQLGKNGYDLIQAKFTQSIQCDQLLELYFSLL